MTDVSQMTSDEMVAALENTLNRTFWDDLRSIRFIEALVPPIFFGRLIGLALNEINRRRLLAYLRRGVIDSTAEDVSSRSLEAPR